MSINLSQQVKYLAHRTPEAAFCTFTLGPHTTRITFAELYERSCAYARYYQMRGIGRGDVVLIILRHSPHLFYSYLGAILAGAVPSFMPFPSPKQRPALYWSDHEALFRRIEPRLIVTYEENAATAERLISTLPIGICVADDSILASPNDPHADFIGLHAQPGDIACLQHSSGTTGLKKGVMLTHRMLFDHHKMHTEVIGFGDGDSIASWLPLYHDMGFIACFMGSLLQGTHLVALDPFEWVMRPRMLLDAIEQYRTTFSWLPNFAFSHLVNGARGEREWDLSSMRAFINCSEPCKPATFDRFLERFHASGVSREKLHVCYAMAENVFAVTQTQLGKSPTVLRADAAALSLGVFSDAQDEKQEQRLLSCGSAANSVAVLVRDHITGEEVAENQIGEIHVTSKFLFGGYYRLPEKTRERLADGWYATGDVGFLHDGELYVTGRVDDMLIVNGRNYYAHEIEALLTDIEGIVPGRCVAIAVEDERSDATVVVVLAECSGDGASAATTSRAKRHILERAGLAIHAFVPVAAGALVKTTSGKISRTKNKELYLRGEFEAREQQNS
ncbi:MAG TPA: AMP-binding protein [Candidatus Dormibacteraeota bacterium]|nr:AMP-binding protein [Candidatus Dormibacteraeota bacterium]